MSAFLVDDKHLSFIITWAIDNGTLGNLPPQIWFKRFRDENVKSLKSRYPYNYKEMLYWDIPQKRYTPTFNAIRPKKYSREIAIAVIKFINCWEYQSCEHKFDENDAIWKMMAKIKILATAESERDRDLHKIPNAKIYDLAPWEYSPEEWKAFLSKLKTQ